MQYKGAAAQGGEGFSGKSKFNEFLIEESDNINRYRTGNLIEFILVVVLNVLLFSFFAKFYFLITSHALINTEKLSLLKHIQHVLGTTVSIVGGYNTNDTIQTIYGILIYASSFMCMAFGTGIVINQLGVFPDKLRNEVYDFLED